MDELRTPIDSISAETAEELINAFKNFNEGARQMNDATIALITGIRYEMIRQATGKFLEYVDKYTSATFVTRWYWKRKVFNMAQALFDLSALLNEETMRGGRRK